ncbi:hypothetical protein FXV77_14295 [Sphingobacterium phlebotomi]|uniref:Uncharacterized protein n=1 Tax=Sphingobacterium phlebotomi TaxID=2605433 RepID=A0A5D4H489_9SPHI|nr:hypothetical protein [Sphingobacterium phlebotomi]TYR35112.1 hypothetical protein FXV77_14295 [Sphingobacterium phlebotomi]
MGTVFIRLLFVSIGLLGIGGSQYAQTSPAFPARGVHNHYFPEAFIYQYTDLQGEYQFVWLCYNPDTREILYIPNDDMLKAVISFPNGDYFGYLIDENGRKQTIRQHVPEVTTEGTEADTSFHRLNARAQDTIVRHREFQHDERIVSSAIDVSYLKSGEKETVYVTEDFEINAYQIYGFNRLEGDMRLPFVLDYIGILTEKQLATDVRNNPYQTAKFNGHTATVYHFDTAGYP